MTPIQIMANLNRTLTSVLSLLQLGLEPPIYVLNPAQIVSTRHYTILHKTHYRQAFLRVLAPLVYIPL